MIIRGGENVYPTEIENFLHNHPKVEDVQVEHYMHYSLLLSFEVGKITKTWENIIVIISSMKITPILIEDLPSLWLFLLAGLA